MLTVVIFNGGEPTASLGGEISEDAYLIAADSGLDTALSWGYDVDLVVGDLDSVSAQGLEATLLPGSTLGVSNVFEAPVATVRMTGGTLLAIQPDVE